MIFTPLIMEVYSNHIFICMTTFLVLALTYLMPSPCYDGQLAPILYHLLFSLFPWGNTACLLTISRNALRQNTCGACAGLSQSRGERASATVGGRPASPLLWLTHSDGPEGAEQRGLGEEGPRHLVLPCMP